MKNKKNLLIIISIILILSILTFFYLNTYKKSKTVNNIDKSNIKEYILNISSYQASITVTVNSNKNTNKYILKQQYNKDKVYKQEVIEPENIKGLQTIYDGKNLKIENTKLNLSHIYEDYQYISDNTLDLYTFLQNYKNSENQEYEQKDNEIIMTLKNQNNNNYTIFQKLYIDKNTAIPTKMEISDKNKNITVYIEYNEISFNSTSKEEILAFLYNSRKLGIWINQEPSGISSHLH